jgi:CheY-like chemotaxis protein
MGRLLNLVMLIVEDNPADVVLFTEALETTHAPASCHVVTNGEDAMRFLRRDAPYTDAPRPDVVILDLNLPVKKGRDVLVELRAEPSLNKTPVAILTTSEWEDGICGWYLNERCRYFIKTGDFHELVEIVRKIVEFAASAARADG